MVSPDELRFGRSLLRLLRKLQEVWGQLCLLEPSASVGAVSDFPPKWKHLPGLTCRLQPAQAGRAVGPAHGTHVSVHRQHARTHRCHLRLHTSA